jgi:long-chain acyl-CoA synthetase
VSEAPAHRPWYRHWPSHVPRSIAYPDRPAWALLESAATRFPDRVAVRELDPDTLAERRVLTYDAVLRAVRGTATGLRDAGVKPGDRIGLCLPNGADLVIGYNATWLAGGVAVPANPAARDGELERHFADAAVSVVIGTGSSSSAELVATRLERPFVGAAAFHAMESLPPCAPGTCDPVSDVAVLLYTGGTTGDPKGAMLTHRNIVANTTQFARWYAFEPGAETCVAAIPMYHSGGMSGVMTVPIAAGATLLTFERFKAATVARAVATYRATRLFGVPTMFVALLNDADARRVDYASLRACRTNAAPLPPAVKAAFDGLVGREVLVEGYGLTETSPLTHANPLHRAKAGSIGVPLPDTDARIVDPDTDDDVEPGASGELVIRGPQVMRAYWNRPDETAHAMRGGWFHTGDIARQDEDGYFAIVDRIKDVINTSGFKVWPREIEETLYTHPAVKLVAVVGVRDDYRGEAVKACVVLKDAERGRITADDLVRFCRERLSGYKVPRAVEFRDELPMTATGKVLRRLLRDTGGPAEIVPAHPASNRHQVTG